MIDVDAILEETGKHSKIILFGPYGGGKTTLAFTAPKPIYAVIIGGADELEALDAGYYRSIRDTSEIYVDIVTEKTDAWGLFPEATGWKELRDVLNTAIAKDEDPNDPFHFETLIIDNVTQLKRLQNNRVIEFVNLNATNKTKTALTRLQKDGIQKLADSDYGLQMSLMSQLADFLHGLKKNVVLVAHEYIEKEQEKGSRTQRIRNIYPNFTGANRQSIPNRFSNCFYCITEGGKYEILTEPDDKIQARTRKGARLAPRILNPDLTQIIEQLAKSPEEK